MKNVISAGGFVLKQENGILLICLVSLDPLRAGYTFPKGHVESDETIEATAG